MQVSAPSFATTLRIVERNAAFAESAADTETQDPALSLEDFVRAGAESRKAFAQDRLIQLKEQMTTLMLFSMKPEALKHLSAQFGRELESAATDFSRAVRTLGDQEQFSTTGTLEENYLETGDSVAPGNFGLSEADRETANGFISAAGMINSLVEISRQTEDDFTDRRESDNTRQSVENVVRMMTRLDTKGLLDPVYL